MVLQRYLRGDRLGITDESGCHDDENGDADEGRKDGEEMERSRVLCQLPECESGNVSVLSSKDHSDCR